MKKDIYGVRVFSSSSNLSRNGITDSCKVAESIVKKIKDSINVNPVEGLNKIEIYRNLESKIIEKEVIADFENIETGMFDRREIIKYREATILTYYLSEENSIQFEDEVFYPLNHSSFIHELGHNVHEHMNEKQKRVILELYSHLKEILIQKIKAGDDPVIEANSILSAYSFIHTYGIKEDNIICFQGYVGKLSKIIYQDNLSTKIKAYAFQRNEDEFFAEAFTAFFCNPQELHKRNLYGLFKKILTSHK